MDRRLFLKVGAAGVAGSMVPYALRTLTCQNNVVYSGWTPNKKATASFIRHSARPYFVQQTPRATIGSGKGRVVLLHKYMEKALGTIVPHDQELGDCTGQAYGFGTDALSATQIYGFGLAERWAGKVSTEATYAGSRYEIGYKRHGSRTILLADGSLGLYCAEFSRDYGVLVRKKYGEYDLTKYNPELAKRWGKEGIPDELEPVAKQHPIRSFALVRSYADCRDAISNGYPVIFCSNVGFNPYCRQCNPSGGRDSMGFLNPCDIWYHAMCGLDVDDTTRPGILIMNSWGPHWVDGPKRHGQPDGSFWVDAHVIDRMCSQGDSYAISGFIGFPSNPIDYNLF